jgi:DNA-binding transcriptional LysR family regulator
MKSIDLTRFDLNLLVVMDALLAERHVGRAGERLHLSQSATSHALGRLRTALGDPLFIRNPKGIEPTPVATELGPRIAALLMEIEGIASRPRPFEPRKTDRTFRVGATDHAIMTALVPALARVNEEAPRAVIHLEAVDRDTVAARLDSTSLDLAIGSTSFAQFPHRIDAIPLFEERFVGIARRGHPGLRGRGRRRSMDMATFIKVRHVLVSLSGEAVGVVDEVLATLGLRRQVAATSPSFIAVPFLVGGGDLVAVIAQSVAQKFRVVANIELFDLPFEVLPWTVSILRASGRATEPELAWLINCISAMKRSGISAVAR